MAPLADQTRRRVRFRCRRADRAPRAAGLAAGRGLPLPRRHGALPLRRAHRRASCRRSRSRSPSTCSSRGRSCSSWRATRPARRRWVRSRIISTHTGRDVDVIGVVAPGDPARGGRQPHRPDRAAGDAGHGRERRLRARGARRPIPHVHLESVACPDLAPIIQSGLPVRRAGVVETVRAYCAPLRAAEVDTVILGCTHYPLIAPHAAADARARRDAGHLRRGRRAQRRARARLARAAQPAARARARYRFRAPATSSPSRRSGPASCRCRSGEWSTSSWRTKVAA